MTRHFDLTVCFQPLTNLKDASLLQLSGNWHQETADFIKDGYAARELGNQRSLLPVLIRASKYEQVVGANSRHLGDLPATLPRCAPQRRFACNCGPN